MSILCQICCQAMCLGICPKNAKDNNLNNQQNNRELQNSLLSLQQEQRQKQAQTGTNNNKQQISEQEQKFSSLVQELYDVSKKMNKVPEQLIGFVGPQQSLQELIQYYAKDNNKIEEKLQKHLIGYCRVRVDGNSFYTAFTYQYLEYVLNILNYTQFNIFIGNIRKMNFQMYYHQDFKIPTEANNSLAVCFADRIIELRKYPQDLFQEYSDSSNLLYGLSILYMRNLVNELYCRSKMAQMVDHNLSKDFLFWEKECSMDELVMAFLAEEMKLQYIDLNCLDKYIVTVQIILQT